MCLNSALSSPRPGSRGPNFRAIAVGALLVMMGTAFLAGCGTTPIPAQPEVTHYDPDLGAADAYLYWGPEVSIGGPMRAGDARLNGGAGVSQVTRDINTVVVGTAAMPALRVVSQGVSGWYRARFYIDDQLWWDVGAVAP